MAENERLKGTRVFNKELFESKMANHPVIKELRGLHQNIVEDNNEVSELFAREAAMKFEKDLDKVFLKVKQQNCFNRSVSKVRKILSGMCT